MQLGDSVVLPTNQRGRIIGLTDLFGRRYADVFIEPDGPVRRVPLDELRQDAGMDAEIGAVALTPAPLFIAQIAAHQLQALMTQQGVLSAANFRVSPLPHQVLAVDFVLGRVRPRVMIADEVGLGKTIEAAMVYEELKLRRQARRCLVIAPAGLTRQWQDELAQKFGEQFVVHDSTMMAALRQLHGQEANLWAVNDQVITSLDFVKPQRMRPDLSPTERERREGHNRRIFQDIVEAGWDVVIFDEAHKLSKQADGTETARYRVGEALAPAVPVFLLLTATPHQGDAGRFLHLLNLLDSYGFNQVADLTPDRVATVVWRTRKRAAVDAQGRRLFKQRVTDIYPVDRSGSEHALERELYEAVTEYVRDNYNRAMGRGDRAFGFLMILFQRLVTSSSEAIYAALRKRHARLAALGQALGLARSDDFSRPGQGTTEEVTTNGEFDEEAASDEDAQAVLNDLLAVGGVVNEAELAREVAEVEQLLELARRAQVGLDAKMAALLTIIDEVCRREGNPAAKFIIFTEFVATQRALRLLLEGMGYRIAIINGEQKLEERIAARGAFAADAQFLVSTDAGGEGINLQFCHVMVNYDLPWNPMKVEQRIGRIDRIGQDHDVLVLNLLVHDTVERRVRAVLEAKLALIRQQFGEDKLADILSTLQDEFRFDRLYMEALVKRQAESAELEELAQQLYERARQVLERDDLLLPQAQAVASEAAQRLVADAGTRIRTLLAGYLAGHGEALQEYRGRPGIYYFDSPSDGGSTAHYADVVFDRERAVADDCLTYLHLNHPLVQQLLGELTDGAGPAVIVLRLAPAVLPVGITLPEGGGLWAVYRLHVMNYADVDRTELVPIFVDQAGTSHPWLARSLLNLAPEHVQTGYLPPGTDLGALQSAVQLIAESQAADRFSELQLEHAERLAAERKKLAHYYRQQEGAVTGIAIENIRHAKHKELLERRRGDLAELDRKSTLVPDLTKIGAAHVLAF